MKNVSKLTAKRSDGFSLVEFLIVIMLIGIMSSIAIPFLGGDHQESFDNARHRRNAQTIATLANGASACGLSVVEPDSVRGTIEKLVAGQVVARGLFKGKTFRVGQLTEEDITGAARFLRVEGDALIYSTNGS